jgi:predicted MFS family arabinose efflux permease
MLALLLPGVALAGGNSVASNLGDLAREYAGELYTGIVAVFALVFLMNRRFTELLVFFCAAIVVGWFVFAPGQVADAAKAIAHQVLP